MTIGLIYLPGKGTMTESHLHLGLGYLNSNLKKNGYDTEVLNYSSSAEKYRNFIKSLFVNEKIEIDLIFRMVTAQIDNIPLIQQYILNNTKHKDLDPLLKIAKYYVNEINNRDFEHIGFTIYFDNEVLTVLVAMMLKDINSKTIIIAGGPQASIRGSLYIQFPFFDYIFSGESEISLIEMLNSSKISTGANDVKFDFNQPQPRRLRQGYWFKSNGSFYFRESKSFPNLEDLPFPDFGEISSNIMYLPVSWSRGCRGACRFCSDRLMSRKWSSRSAKNVFQEIKHQTTRYGIKHFLVCNEYANGNIDMLSELCDLIINEELDLTFVANFRAEKLTQKICSKLHKAGFRKILCGIESFSSNVLNLMNKRITIEESLRNIKLMSEAGIFTSLNIIIGFPGETEDDFIQTFYILRDNKQYFSHVSINQFQLLYPSFVYFFSQEFNLFKEQVVNFIPMFCKTYTVEPYISFSWKYQNINIEVIKNRIKRISRMLKEENISFS